MASHGLANPNHLDPRAVRVLAPRMSPIITDESVSIVLTDDYRLNPYLVRKGAGITVAGIVIAGACSVPLRYVMGTDLDPEQMWLSVPRRHGLRIIHSDWVLHFDCNPDLMLARPVEEQNAYLATRDHLGLPELRWAADLRFMAERYDQALRSVVKATSVAGGERMNEDRAKEGQRRIFSSHL
ncbi:hypothetical protein BU25DRAFT_425047 [Macroventuria anomochaeta]|uniref:Uncharacterized protein n=1 Tax=Macroventuria anomochaeta TaxID=301207 RepID=A0ACB6RNI9_9PLEO|nr:uncharacterized protein BU25DRAFT_425047 [Macroventuria anomochaeta]KAF2623282.1 hypothetical protein BU25DRAFT_425047 [Macroventuria anomochaeta]